MPSINQNKYLKLYLNCLSTSQNSNNTKKLPLHVIEKVLFQCLNTKNMICMQNAVCATFIIVVQ